MRPDLELVAELVPWGSRVLDVGCGDGTLLASLIVEHGCRGTGVEIDGEAFLAAVANGVPVLSFDLDDPSALRDLATDSYDVAVLSQTLQTMRRPAAVLAELARISPRVVLSVPNFGLWRHRVSLAVGGRMPVSAELPYPWYQTPNIHLSTLPDLEALVADLELDVDRRVLLDEHHRPLRVGVAANLRAARAVYALSRARHASG